MSRPAPAPEPATPTTPAWRPTIAGAPYAVSRLPDVPLAVRYRWPGPSGGGGALHR